MVIVISNAVHGIATVALAVLNAILHNAMNSKKVTVFAISLRYCRNALSSYTQISVVDVIEVVVAMWLEARHRTQGMLHVLFK